MIAREYKVICVAKKYLFFDKNKVRTILIEKEVFIYIYDENPRNVLRL